MPNVSLNECMTVVFKKNVTDFDKNPLHIQSEFGEVVAISRGDVLEERDRLAEHQAEQPEDVVVEAIKRTAAILRQETAKGIFGHDYVMLIGRAEATVTTMGEPSGSDAKTTGVEGVAAPSPANPSEISEHTNPNLMDIKLKATLAAHDAAEKVPGWQFAFDAAWKVMIPYLRSPAPVMSAPKCECRDEVGRTWWHKCPIHGTEANKGKAG